MRAIRCPYCQQSTAGKSVQMVSFDLNKTKIEGLTNNESDVNEYDQLGKSYDT